MTQAADHDTEVPYRMEERIPSIEDVKSHAARVGDPSGNHPEDSAERHRFDEGFDRDHGNPAHEDISDR